MLSHAERTISSPYEGLGASDCLILLPSGIVSEPSPAGAWLLIVLAIMR